MMWWMGFVGVIAFVVARLVYRAWPTPDPELPPVREDRGLEPEPRYRAPVGRPTPPRGPSLPRR